MELIIGLFLGLALGIFSGIHEWNKQRGNDSRKWDAYEPKTKRKKHFGKCDGDCANCPPHYGYRYGRWYYGHDHMEGCEFGGNKGSGSMD